MDFCRYLAIILWLINIFGVVCNVTAMQLKDGFSGSKELHSKRLDNYCDSRGRKKDKDRSKNRKKNIHKRSRRRGRARSRSRSRSRSKQEHSTKRELTKKPLRSKSPSIPLIGSDNYLYGQQKYPQLKPITPKDYANFYLASSDCSAAVVNYCFTMGYNQKIDDNTKVYCCFCATLNALIAGSLSNKQTIKERISLVSELPEVVQLLKGICVTYDWEEFFENQENFANGIKKILKEPLIEKIIPFLKDATIQNHAETILHLPISQLSSNDKTKNNYDRINTDQQLCQKIEKQLKELQERSRESIIAVVCVNGHYFTVCIKLHPTRNNTYYASVINSVRYRWIVGKGYWSTGFYDDKFSLEQDLFELEKIVEQIILNLDSKLRGCSTRENMLAPKNAPEPSQNITMSPVYIPVQISYIPVQPVYVSMQPNSDTTQPVYMLVPPGYVPVLVVVPLK